MKTVLLTSLDGVKLERAWAALGGESCAVARDAEMLPNWQDDTVLLTFGTSVIVPEAIFARCRAAYNVHAASPHYPGRDPHHWAIYDGASRYGATLHVMTKRPDEGPIVDVEWFAVRAGATPSSLLEQAEEAALKLIERYGSAIARGEQLPASDIRWGGTKRSRKDFLAMCRLPSTIDQSEFDRRYNAFDGGRYDNLTVEVHGRVFRIDKSDSET